jgi:hypothetical protein
MNGESHVDLHTKIGLFLGVLAGVSLGLVILITALKD